MRSKQLPDQPRIPRSWDGERSLPDSGSTGNCQAEDVGRLGHADVPYGVLTPDHSERRDDGFDRYITRRCANATGRFDQSAFAAIERTYDHREGPREREQHDPAGGT